MSFSKSCVGASTERYSCVTFLIFSIASGNCALVTRKVDIFRLWNSSSSSFKRGYVMGSPVSDKATCLMLRYSSFILFGTLSFPSRPTSSPRWASIACLMMCDGSSIGPYQLSDTGAFCPRQQNVHLLAQNSEVVICRHWCDRMPYKTNL